MKNPLTLIRNTFLSLISATKATKAARDVRAVALNNMLYHQAAEKRAREMIDSRFINYSVAHTTAVLEAMEKWAPKSDEVLVYSRALALAFYHEIFENSTHRFRIVLEEESGIQVINSLSESAKARIVYRCLPPASIFKEAPHMILVGNGFRVDSPDCERDELFAVGNFYEPRIVAKLKDRFEQMWEDAFVSA